MVARILWGTLGSVALILGAIGLFLPGLPTTPFILVAVACFSRSSQRLSRWLRHESPFQEVLRNWEAGRRISRRAKISALLVMAAGVFAAFWMLASKPLLLAGIITVISCVALYIASRPE